MGEESLEAFSLPPQSPLFHARNQARYDRQTLIREYESKFNCRLVVLIDAIFPENLTLFEELLYDADSRQDLHLMLVSPGGDGETAVRMVRSAQSRCKQLTVVLPDQAKSAATLLALGAHKILWGPAGDLGPIDPQFQVGRGQLVSARDIINSVDEAERRVQQNPAAYPLYASLLSDVTMLMVEQAKSESARSAELLRAALSSNKDRDPKLTSDLVKKLLSPLTEAKSHGAVFGPTEALEIDGFPGEIADTSGEQWQMLWRLWTKYFVLDPMRMRVYEGQRQSHILRWYDDFDQDEEVEEFGDA